MPAKNRRSQGQAARSRDESSAGREEQAFERVVADSRGHRSPSRPPTRRSVDVDASEVSRAVRVLSPPIDRCRRSPTLSARAQAWLTHADDAPKRQGPLRKLPSNILTVER